MWEFQNASGDFPPDSAIATPAVLLKDVVYPMEDCGRLNRSRAANSGHGVTCKNHSSTHGAGPTGRGGGGGARLPPSVVSGGDERYCYGSGGDSVLDYDQ